jgi:hypothetical protein
MGPAQSQETSADGALCLLDALMAAQALGHDRCDGRERVLDAVMQLLENQLLQRAGRIALPGLDAGLGQHARHVDLGLCQLKP